MKLGVLLTILILSFSLHNLNAQQLVDLYKNHLPEKALADELVRTNIELSLTNYGKLNPNLIYLYILYLDIKFNNKIDDPDSNYFNILKNVRYNYRSIITDWYNTQVRKIDQNISYRIDRNWIKSYLDQLSFEPYQGTKTEFTVPVDSNKMYYFSLIYFTRKNNEYNASENYFHLIEEYLTNKAN